MRYSGVGEIQHREGYCGPHQEGEDPAPRSSFSPILRSPGAWQSFPVVLRGLGMESSRKDADGFRGPLGKTSPSTLEVFFFKPPAPWGKAPPSNGFQDQGAGSSSPYCRIPAPRIHLGVPEGWGWGGAPAWVFPAGLGDLASLTSRELVDSSGKVGGSGGWGLGWRLGKWQFVERKLAGLPTSQAMFAGRKVEAEAVGGFQWRRGR